MMPAPFLIVSGDFVLTGGMDLGNYHFADFVARQGNPLHLVSHRVDTNLLEYPNVTWHRASRPWGMHSVGEHFLRREGYRIAKILAPENPRILVNGGNCPLSGINWVHYVHAATQAHGGSNLLRTLKSQWVHSDAKAREKVAFQRAQAIVVNSDQTKLDLIKFYDISPEYINTIYYGTNPEVFHPTDDATKKELRLRFGLPRESFVSCFIGALGDRRKGFDTLFNAWKNLGSRFEMDLVVVGSGSELSIWKDRAKKLLNGNRIHFLGFRKDVPDILKACDAFIAPTRYESFGLAVQEALLCGLSTIVSARSGVAELIPDALQTLLLKNPDDVSELTEKIIHLHTNRVQFRDKTIQLSKQLALSTWDLMSERIYKILQDPKIA